MITAGLLLSLSPDAEISELMRLLEEHPAFLPGVPLDRWLPVAMEARDDRESRSLHDWIGAQSGVVFVDVIHVNFEPEPLPL